MKKSEQEIKANIIDLTSARGENKSVCPSEVARSLFSETWRSHMDKVHMAAVKLNKQGLIKITQNGRAVDPEKAKGPIRLSLVK